MLLNHEWKSYSLVWHTTFCGLWRSWENMRQGGTNQEGRTLAEDDQSRLQFILTNWKLYNKDIWEVYSDLLKALQWGLLRSLLWRGGFLVVVAFSSLARIRGECSIIHIPPALFFFFFWVEISSRSLIPLFRPWSVHIGSASWDDCDPVFPDELRVSSFPDRFHTMPG